MLQIFAFKLNSFTTADRFSGLRHFVYKHCRPKYRSQVCSVFKHSVYLIGYYLYCMTFSYGILVKLIRILSSVYDVFINKYRETRSF